MSPEKRSAATPTSQPHSQRGQEQERGSQDREELQRLQPAQGGDPCS
jgi:hypothetical protein